DLFAEIAKLELGAWNKLDARVLTKAAEQAALPGRSLTQLVGLLGLRLRYATEDAFPRDLISAIDAAVLAPDYATVPAADEATEVLTLTAAVLAAQLFPEMPSPQAEQTLSAWLRQRGMYGFTAYD